jgi:hypothetical protein
MINLIKWEFNGWMDERSASTAIKHTQQTSQLSKQPSTLPYFAQRNEYIMVNPRNNPAEQMWVNT